MQHYIRYVLPLALLCSMSYGGQSVSKEQQSYLVSVVESGYKHDMLSAEDIDLCDKACAGYELADEEYKRLSDICDRVAREAYKHGEDAHELRNIAKSMRHALREPRPEEDAELSDNLATYVPRDLVIRRINGLDGNPVEFLNGLNLGGNSIFSVNAVSSPDDIIINYDTDGSGSPDVFAVQQDDDTVFRANSSGVLDAETTLDMKDNNIFGIQPANGNNVSNVSLSAKFNSVACAQQSNDTISVRATDEQIELSSSLADPGGNLSNLGTAGSGEYVVPENGFYLAMATLTSMVGAGDLTVRLQSSGSPANKDTKVINSGEFGGITLLAIDEYESGDTIFLLADNNNSSNNVPVDDVSLAVMRVG